MMPFPIARPRLREEQLFLVIAVIVGIVAGLSAVLFTLGIEFVARILFGVSPSHARLFLVPPLVSIVTGVALAKVVPDVRGSGVPQTKAAYHLAGGRMRWRVPVGKFITGILCIGSGHSMGREGPSVQIGAGLASIIGQWLNLSPRRVRELIPVGAAGALAAAFNTPVAAVLFALEEIIGDMNAPLLGSTVVASVSAVIVERSILGNEPLFHVPTYHLEHPAELAAYALLGIVGGGVSLLFCKTLLALRRAFLSLPASTKVVQPAIGGIVIGAMLLYSPAVMGVGYEYVDQALNGGLILQTLIVLCLLKVAATIVSYTSGNAGGIFAPSLYIGAMAGGAVGMLVHAHAPFPTAEAGAYALVGMGTVFAGIVRAPMTSVFMIFEITQDYQILVPLMVANMLSFLISKRFQRLPIYEALLLQDNIHLPHGAPKMVTASRTARDVMQGDAATVTDVPPVHVHPDHPLEIILERLAESGGELPVISRADARRVEGVITADSILTVLGRRKEAR